MSYSSWQFQIVWLEGYKKLLKGAFRPGETLHYRSCVMGPGIPKAVVLRTPAHHPARAPRCATRLSVVPSLSWTGSAQPPTCIGSKASHEWGLSWLQPYHTNQSALTDAPLNESVKVLLAYNLLIPSSLPELQAYFAFHMHPNHQVYTSCSGKAIFTHNYEGVKLEWHIHARALLRHKLHCLWPVPDANESNQQPALSIWKFRLQSPSTAQWAISLNVSCIFWTTSSLSAGCLAAVCMCSAGAHRIAWCNWWQCWRVSLWAWVVLADVSPTRCTITPSAGIQVASQPGYNQMTWLLFVPAQNKPVHHHLHACLLTATARSMSKLLPLLFTILFVPGFFSRTDTCSLSMVDEQEHKHGGWAGAQK